MFGDTGLLPATEESPMLPGSPYAVSKLLSHQLINIYRQKYKCFATSGILFNHESPLRSEKFLSKKITSGVVKILKGLSDEICLGNMEIRRDWSFAGDTVNAVWSTLQLNSPSDFIIASGDSKTVGDFVDVAFNFVGLKDYKKYVKIDKKLFRSNEALTVQGNPTKARELLHWTPKYSFQNLIELLMEEELKN
jgi:GDPmannose 4,6-dehydratase